MCAKRFHYLDEIQFDGETGHGGQLYEKLSVLLRRRGSELSGCSMLSERQAAEALGVNRTAVHRAYEKLVSDGLLERSAGARNYRISAFDAIRCGQCLGLVLPYILSEYINSGHYLHMRVHLYCGIADRAAEYGLGILPLTLPPPGSRKSEMEAFRREKLPSLAGVIHLGNRNLENDTVLDTLWQNRSIPQVCLLSQNKYAHCGSVSFDHVLALQAEARHLQDYGHRKLALFSPKFHNIQGLRYVLQSIDEAADIFREYGLEIRREWCFEIDRNSPAPLEEAFDQFLAMPDHPRAIWCRSDCMAIRLLELMHEREKRVPQEYSIVSMDNLPECGRTDPPLTTLQLPFYGCGRAAVDMLLEIRRSGSAIHQRIKRIPASLIVRASVGPSRERYHQAEPF